MEDAEIQEILQFVPEFYKEYATKQNTNLRLTTTTPSTDTISSTNPLPSLTAGQVSSSSLPPLFSSVAPLHIEQHSAQPFVFGAVSMPGLPVLHSSTVEGTVPVSSPTPLAISTNTTPSYCTPQYALESIVLFSEQDKDDMRKLPNKECIYDYDNRVNGPYFKTVN